MRMKTILLLISLSLPTSRAFRFQDNAKSNDGCEERCPKSEFCGVDGRCHRFSCEAWYSLGPTFFTAYNSSISEDLFCYTFAENETDDRSYRDVKPICPDARPVATQFLPPGTSSQTCPVKGVPSMQFMRKCTAQPNPHMAFVCYDMVGNDGLTGDGYQLEQYKNATDEAKEGEHRYSLSIDARNSFIFLPLGESLTALDVTTLQATMKSSLLESKSDDQSVFGYCNPGCRDREFCGADQQCHVFDCDNLYSFGPESMAGVLVTDTTPSELKCEFKEVTAQVGENLSLNKICGGQWPVALEHRCVRNNVFTTGGATHCPSSTNNPTVSFARRCSGRRNPSQSFVCYDMKSVQASALNNFSAAYQTLALQHLDTDCNDTSLPSDYPPCSEFEDDDKRGLNCITTRHRVTHILQNYSMGWTYSTTVFQPTATEDFSLSDLSQAFLSMLNGDLPPLETDTTQDSGGPSKMKIGGDCLFWQMVFAVVSAYIVIRV